MPHLFPGSPIGPPALDVVMRLSSLDRVLAAGPDAAVIVDRVRDVAGAADAVVEMSMTGIAREVANIAAAEARFTTAIVGLDHPVVRDEHVRQLFAALHRAAQTVFVYVSLDPHDPHAAPAMAAQAYWEGVAIACGFRRHPLRSRLLGAAAAGAAHAGATVHLLLEASSEAIVAPDSDAVLSRYERAAAFIRRNDRVLDLDAGSGAGLTTIARAAMPAEITGIVPSEDAAARACASSTTAACACDLRVGDASDLSWLDDESIDVMVSCRSLPIGRWSAAAVDEVQRVLTPGGRLICGSSGIVSSQDDIDARQRLAERFLVEHADGDWRTAVLMKDPFSGHASTYRERWGSRAAFPGGANPTTYVRTFDNPWLYDSLFLQGARLSNGALLEQLCQRILSLDETRYDAAGASCVLGYRLLDATGTDPDAFAAWLALADRQIDALGGDAPATIRWRVSVRFLAGRVAMRAGRRDAARAHLQACAWEDATKFSSLLCTKTTEAAYWLGVLAARDGDTHAATRAWRRGVSIASECLRVEAHTDVAFEQPFEMFGFREFSQVLENAGRCAAALDALAAGPWWEERLNRLAPFASTAVFHWPAAFAAGRATVQRELNQELSSAQRKAVDAKVAATESLLRHALHAGRRTSRRLLVWGAGAAGRAVLQRMTALGGSVDGFIDSNPAARGGIVADLPVFAPEALRSAAWRGALVIIASIYVSDIEASLMAFGLKPDADFLSIDRDVLERWHTRTSSPAPVVTTR
jgi:SAM-dependent methyltransferase